MNPSGPDGQEVYNSSVCAHCGRGLSVSAAQSLQPQHGSECICEDCYHDLLIPGPGDAYGNMS